MSYDYVPSAIRIPTKYRQESSANTIHVKTALAQPAVNSNTQGNASLSGSPASYLGSSGLPVAFDDTSGPPQVPQGPPAGYSGTPVCFTGFPQFDSVSPSVPSLSKLMDQKSPPNVVINSLTNQPVPQPQPLVDRTGIGGSSSPEPEETNAKGEVPPPNITISGQTFQQGPRAGDSTNFIIPTTVETPLYNLQIVPEGALERRILKFPLDEHNLVIDLQENPSTIGQPALSRDVWEIKNFSLAFKTMRIQAGFSLSDVVNGVHLIYGPELDELAISKFESLQIPLARALSMRPLLERWMESIRRNRRTAIESINKSSSDSEQEQKRCFGRKRTKIDQRNRQYMEQIFQECPKPTYEQLINIATKTNLDRDVVRVWFSNRRQKERRRKEGGKALVYHTESVNNSAEGMEGGPQNHYRRENVTSDGKGSFLAPFQTHQYCSNQQQAQPVQQGSGSLDFLDLNYQLFTQKPTSPITEDDRMNDHQPFHPSTIKAEFVSGVPSEKRSVIVPNAFAKSNTVGRGVQDFMEQDTMLMTPKVEEESSSKSEEDWEQLFRH